MEALFRKRNQFHLNALLRKRNQGKRKQTFNMMIQLQKKNLPQDVTMVKTSLETRMIQFFRKLKECFTDGYHGEWAGFYNQGYPASSRHRPMFWHVKYRKTMSFHQNYWYHLTDDQLMAEHIARHKNQQPLLELEDDVLEDAAPVTRPEDRHGQFLIRQLPHEHQRLLHEITLSSMHALTGADLEGRRAPVRGEISYFSMLLMMEALNFAPFNTFMELYAPSMNFSMNFEVSYDTYHELKLSIHDVLEDNRHITSDNVPDVEDPELVGDDPETPLPGNQWQGRVDPEYKGSIETLSCENKHIILESEDDNLVECTLQWLRMCNKNAQRKIMERVVKKEAKDEKRRGDRCRRTTTGYTGATCSTSSSGKHGMSDRGVIFDRLQTWKLFSERGTSS